MHLDIRTVIFITAIAHALHSIGVFLISRSWIKSHTLNIVAIGLAFGSLGGFMMSFRDIIHPFFSIVLANVFVLASPVFTLEAVFSFHGIRSKARLVGPIFMASLIPILFYATFIEPHLRVRIIVMSLYFGTLATISCYFLLSKIQKNLLSSAYPLAFSFMFATVMMSTRIIWVSFQTDWLSFMNSGFFQSFIQLSHLIYIIGVTLGFILLHTRKMGLELTFSLKECGSEFEDQFNFVDILSHELKTPIATIQNSIESLSMRFKDMDIVAEKAVDRIHRSLKRLDNIAAVGLNHHQFIFDKAHHKITRISVVELVEMSAEICRGAFPEHKVIIKYDKSYAGQKYIYGGKRALLTVLNNIFENSMKFSPIHKQILVEIGQSDEMLTLAIKDKGCGVDFGHEERVFDKYFRCENAENITGTGFGLFFVKHILEAHNGSIKLQNRKNGGCRVDMLFPFDYNKNIQK